MFVCVLPSLISDFNMSGCWFLEFESTHYIFGCKWQPWLLNALEDYFSGSWSGFKHIYFSSMYFTYTILAPGVFCLFWRGSWQFSALDCSIQVADKAVNIQNSTWHVNNQVNPQSLWWIKRIKLCGLIIRLCFLCYTTSRIPILGGAVLKGTPDHPEAV